MSARRSARYYADANYRQAVQITASVLAVLIETGVSAVMITLMYLCWEYLIFG